MFEFKAYDLTELHREMMQFKAKPRVCGVRTCGSLRTERVFTSSVGPGLLHRQKLGRSYLEMNCTNRDWCAPIYRRARALSGHRGVKVRRVHARAHEEGSIDLHGFSTESGDV